MENEQRLPANRGQRGRKRAKSRSFYSRQGRNTVVRLLSILKLYVAGIASPIPPTLAAFAGLLTLSSMHAKFALTVPASPNLVDSPASPFLYVPFLFPPSPSCFALPRPSIRGARRVNCRSLHHKYFFPSETRPAPGANSIRRRCTIAVAPFSTLSANSVAPSVTVVTLKKGVRSFRGGATI